MLTSRQAADRLGVSQRRVIALLQAGDLSGRRFGRSWMIDEESVEGRARQPRLRGRPSMGVKDTTRIERYTLMNAHREVASFAYDRVAQRIGSVRPLADAAWAPPGACGINGEINGINLNGWVARRHIPPARQNLAETLRAAGVANAPELMFASLGLNLSDQYWFRPEEAALSWDEVNYFDNAYQERPASLRAKDGARKDAPQGPAGPSHHGPGASTGGQLAKWWERRAGTDYLIKGYGALRHEPYAELLASHLYERLLDPEDFVPYTVEEHAGEPYSVCPCFVTRSTEFVPLCDLELRFGTGYPRSRYDNYVALLERLGIPQARRQLAKMIVCDYLMANADRHDGNLGAIRDTQTLTWAGVAPIFDNGRAFYFGATDRAELAERLFRYEANPFETRPGAQLALVSDFGWFDPSTLDGFTDEIRDVFAHNTHLPSWFGEAAAEQFTRRLNRVVEAADEAAY